MRFVSAALALLLGASALAQPPGELQMGLSPAQARILRNIHFKYEGRQQDVQMRLQARRLELAQLLRGGDVDKSVVSAKLDEILELERQRQHIFLDEIYEAKGQLSPQQWSRFRQRFLRHLLQERRGRGRINNNDDD